MSRARSRSKPEISWPAAGIARQPRERRQSSRARCTARLRPTGVAVEVGIVLGGGQLRRRSRLARCGGRGHGFGGGPLGNLENARLWVRGGPVSFPGGALYSGAAAARFFFLRI